MTLLLDEDDVKTIYETSEDHAERLIEENREEVYLPLIEKSEFQKEVVGEISDNAVSIIREQREEDLNQALEYEKYEDGWAVKDPYFLLAVQPIFPLLIDIYVKKGYSTYMLKNDSTWNPTRISERCHEHGEKHFTTWKDAFNNRQKEYYRDLGEGIRLKLGVQKEKGNFSLTENDWRGIPKGVVVDVLGRLRKAVKQTDYDHVIKNG